MTRPIVALGQPIYENSPASAHMAMLRLVAHSVAAGLDIRLQYVEGQRIDNARNLLVQWALDEGASHLLMVDADMVPPADALERLLAHGVPVVGGYCLARGTAYPPVPETLAFADDGEMRLVFPVGLEQVAFVGTGCILIDADVFRALAPDWPFRSEPGGPGEDVYFAQRCIDAEIPVFVDGDVPCGHVFSRPLFPPDASDQAAMRPYSESFLAGVDAELRRERNWSMRLPR